MKKSTYSIKKIFIFSFFSLLSLFVKAQNEQKFNIIKGKIEVLDSILKVSYDSVLSKEINVIRLLELYDSSFIENKGYGYAYIFNKDKTQYCRLSSKATDGSWSDYITVGITKKEIATGLFFDKPVFTSHQYIKVGINEKRLRKIVNKIPNCILSNGKMRIIKYYWFNTKSLDYSIYKIPSYVASFIFNNDELIKFGFGKYKAELDNDFFPKNYKIAKGKIYQ
jgi:hypothetical protein